MTTREWLIAGGGGYDGGEDGLRASTWTAEGLIDMLEAYEEHIIENVRSLRDSGRLDAALLYEEYRKSKIVREVIE